MRGHPHFCPTASPLSLLGPRPQVSTDSSPEALWPEVVQKPQQVDSSEDKAHLHSSERGGIGQRGGRQSLRERDEPGRKRLREKWREVGRAPWSGGGNGSATSELDNHLLAVTAGAPVAHLLQRAGGLSQQYSPLARGGEEGEGKVAAGQKDGGRPLSLARPGVHLSCGNEEILVGAALWIYTLTH